MIQRWHDTGPVSQTMGRHHASIGSLFRSCWGELCIHNTAVHKDNQWEQTQ